MFDLSVAVKNGVSGADPEASPEDVLAENIVNMRNRVERGDDSPTRLLLTLDGLTTETVTVELWVLARPNNVPADRFFARIATAVLVTSHRITEVTGTVTPGGELYVRVTAETVAADRRLMLQEAA